MTTTPVDVLLVEDNEGDVKLATSIIQKAFGVSVAVRTVGSFSDAKAALLERVPDIIVLDLMLPDSEGINTLQAMKLLAAATPIIVLTGMDGEATELAAIEGGALQLLSKNHEYASLPRALIRARLDAEKQQGTYEVLHRRLNAIHALVQRDTNKIDAVQRDVSMLVRTIYGNGQKDHSLAYRVDSNTHTLKIARQLFWLAVGCAATAAAGGLSAWLAR